MDLHIDPDELNTCVQCGLCLPHCPTYRVTGDETMSPRGRIRLMREVQHHNAPVTTEVLDAFDACIQCRGCEPACPSGVPYGRLIEATRTTLAAQGRTTPRLQRWGLAALTRPRLLHLGARVLAIAQRLRLLPKRLGLSQPLPLRQRRLPTTGTDVLLFTGCVMDATQRHVHLAATEVLTVAGFGVEPTGRRAPCCGALHGHAGLAAEARALAQQVIDAFDDDRPIIVDSAGCGAAMKEYGHLLGTEQGAAFARRVVDLGEFLAPHVEALGPIRPLDIAVAVQDPCHLRHVQKVHLATRELLRPFVRELVELDEDGLCCGAGGAYSIMQPELAASVRERKLAQIDARSPDVVASANPGCSMHLAGAGVKVAHPIELVNQALRG